MTIAAAKINLALHVTGVRADGYHLLSSLVAFSEYGDALKISAAENFSIVTDGEFSDDLPAMQDNILFKIWQLWQEFYPDIFLHIELTKNLPVASGIGGGSSNAAALIRYLQIHAPLEPKVLSKLMLKIGADVPMCFEGQPCLVSGIGDEISTVKLPDFSLILVNPKKPCSTAAVFGALTQKNSPPLTPPVMQEYHQMIDYLGTVYNDLRTPASEFVPEINEILEVLRQDCHHAGLSGSGATCYGILPTFETAKLLLPTIQNYFPDYWVVATKASHNQSSH